MSRTSRFKENIPSWLSSRSRIISFVAFELILYLSFLSYFAIRQYTIPLEYSTYFAFCFLVWVILSYIFGRYKFKKNNIKGLITSNFIKTIAVFLFTFNIAFVTECIFLPNEFKTNVFMQTFMAYSFICFSVYFLYYNRFANTLKYQNVFALVTSTNRFDEIRNLVSPLGTTTKLIHYKFLSAIEVENIFKFDGIIIDKRSLEEQEYNKVLNLKQKGIGLVDLVSFSELFLQRIPSDILVTSDLLSYKLTINWHDFNFKIKRLGDIFVSSILIILTFPLLLIASIFIYIEDQGPIFYSQLRTGLDLKPFRIWKLRTMNINAEADGAQWSVNKDPRITMTGRILRRTRIDELPQLISVVSGQMSLIGPRPERPEIDKLIAPQIPNYNLRYLFRPGLSGWSQVNYTYGASIEDSKVKLSYDLYYLYKFSILLDLLILLKTIKLVFNAKGAISKNK